MTTGRPKASSREALAEAACELFLEQGYERTTVAEIAGRAGVGRSTFFNYFSSKADVLWGGLDERIATFADLVESADVGRRAVDRALVASIAGLEPDSLALGIVNAAQMGLEDELERDASVRRSRIASIAAAHLRASGTRPLVADIAAGAYAAAVIAAIVDWARSGAARTALQPVVSDAVGFVSESMLPE